MNKNRKLFGKSDEELQRQMNLQQNVKHEFDLGPINIGNKTPVISGGQKILEDPKLREQVRKIFVS